MARITIEDCLKNVSNRFLLVNMVAQRVRQIREGSDYLVSSPKNEDVVVALREVAAGKIDIVKKELCFIVLFLHIDLFICIQNENWCINKTFQYTGEKWPKPTKMI